MRCSTKSAGAHAMLSMRNAGDLSLTICSLIRLPSSSTVRILKSIPIVLHEAENVSRAGAKRALQAHVMKDGVHASSQKRRRRHDFPTPRRSMEASRQLSAVISSEMDGSQTRVTNEQ